MEGKTKILYVEDEPFLGKIVKESLESRNFEVRMVADGQHVISAFESFRPDICVLDVMLPNKDGFTIGKEIRSRRHDAPIIFLTAKTQTQDLLDGFRSGGNDYIRKPFSMEELIARIENLLQLTQDRQKVADPSVSFSLGRYRFFPQKFELCFGEKARKLSHRETELLRILCEHRNQSVDRREILRRLWGDDSLFNSRNLDVYIAKLRDYLRDDPQVQIVTLKGVGYHFVVEG